MHVATKTKVWTLEEVHSLPDDGNKYELVRGELFVTPPPGGTHETILARLLESNRLQFVERMRSSMISRASPRSRNRISATREGQQLASSAE